MRTAKDILPADAYESIDFLAEVFKSVGLDIVKMAGKVDHTDKSDGSPVTDVDIQTEDKIRSAFIQKFPNIAIYGEESGYSGELPELFWLIDPIDGTQSFINNVPAYTSMGVLIYKEEAMAGIIYNPSNQELFMAKSGMGATKNSAPINLYDMPLTNVVLTKESILDQMSQIFSNDGIKCRVTHKGGGYGFTEILNNQADARFQLRGGGQLHDYAPGALLIKEAGGDLIPIIEDKYTYRTRSFIACHPNITQTLKNKLQQIRILEDPKNTAF